MIITVDRDLVETVHNRFKVKRVPKKVMINNWIDEKKIYPIEKTYPKVVSFKEKYGLEDKFVIMCFGNMGLYYDLENLFKVIENSSRGRGQQTVKKWCVCFWWSMYCIR